MTLCLEKSPTGLWCDLRKGHGKNHTAHDLGGKVVETWPKTPTTLKDSGSREEWDTGSRRDTREGKGRYDLLPWAAIRALARIMEEGAKKYGDRNWEKGQPCSRYLDSALRHLGYFASGQADEPHLWQALWNIACLIETQSRIEAGSLPRELDDMPGGIPDYERLFWTAKDTNDFEECLRRDRERIEAEENRRDRHKEKQE